MIDLHNHILPELDDGSRSIEETIEMGKIAESEGISKIIITTHHRKPEYIIDKNDILKKIEFTNELFKKENINIEIFPGMEVFIDRDIPVKLKNNELLSLNNSSYLLIEFPMREKIDYIDDVLHEVRVQGYKPIIAHPERYLEVIKNPNYVKKLIEEGCFIQINASSLTGYFGKESKETAEILVKHNMVHLMGTDAHSSRSRAPRIKEAVELMKQIENESYAEKIMSNASKVFNNQEIIVEKPLEYQQKQSFGSKVKKLLKRKKK